MSLDIEASDGQRAAQLMADIAPYFDKVRLAIIEKWENSPISDVEGQHELRLMRKLLNDLEANIQQVIDTGKLAKVQIEKESLFSKVRNII